MNESGTGSTLRELSAWGSFIIMASLFSWYLSRVIESPTSVLAAMGIIIGMIFYIVVAEIFVGIFVACASPKEPDDERDRHITKQSKRYSDWVLRTGVILSILLLFAQQASWLPVYAIAYDIDATAEQVSELPGLIRDIREDIWRHPVLAGHAFMITLVLSDMTRSLTIAVDYRRGA